MLFCRPMTEDGLRNAVMSDIIAVMKAAGKTQRGRFNSGIEEATDWRGLPRMNTHG
jgi:hypothetical protein